MNGQKLMHNSFSFTHIGQILSVVLTRRRFWQAVGVKPRV